MDPRSSVGLPDIGIALNRPSHPSPSKPPFSTVYQPASPLSKRPRSLYVPVAQPGPAHCVKRPPPAGGFRRGGGGRPGCPGRPCPGRGRSSWGAAPPIRSGTAPARPAASVRLPPPAGTSREATVTRPPAATTTPAASRALRRRGSVERRPASVSRATQEPSTPSVRDAPAPQPGQIIPGSGPRRPPPQYWHLVDFMAEHLARAPPAEGDPAPDGPYTGRARTGKGEGPSAQFLRARCARLELVRGRQPVRARSRREQFGPLVAVRALLDLVQAAVGVEIRLRRGVVQLRPLSGTPRSPAVVPRSCRPRRRARATGCTGSGSAPGPPTSP